MFEKCLGLYIFAYFTEVIVTEVNREIPNKAAEVVQGASSLFCRAVMKKMTSNMNITTLTFKCVGTREDFH